MVALAGILLGLFAWVVAHDPGPGLALSRRGWITLAGAALVAVLVAKRRSERLLQFARRIGEYALVVFVAVALATAAPASPTDPAPAEQAQAKAATAAPAFGTGCPGIARTRAWLTCLLKQANDQADQQGGKP